MRTTWTVNSLLLTTILCTTRIFTCQELEALRPNNHQDVWYTKYIQPEIQQSSTEEGDPTYSDPKNATLKRKRDIEKTGELSENLRPLPSTEGNHGEKLFFQNEPIVGPSKKNWLPYAMKGYHVTKVLKPRPGSSPWQPNLYIWGSNSDGKYGQAETISKPNPEPTSDPYKWQSNPIFWGKRDLYSLDASNDVDYSDALPDFLKPSAKNADNATVKGYSLNQQHKRADTFLFQKGNYWPPRGKKEISVVVPPHNTEWMAQTKKDNLVLPRKINYWLNRGKRSNGQVYTRSARSIPPAAREQKLETPKRDEDLFLWAPRGKRQDYGALFKSRPSYWTNRGRRTSWNLRNTELLEELAFMTGQNSPSSYLSDPNRIFRQINSFLPAEKSRGKKGTEEDLIKDIGSFSEGFMAPRG